MSVLRYEPWSLLNQLQREMDTLIRRDTETASPVSDWTPAVDIQETEHAYILHADVPGVKPEDIEINMENNVLTINGSRNVVTTEDTDSFKRVERTRGKFYRRFSLPDSVDAEKITAKTLHGVLEVTIPKQAKVVPRKIQIQVAA